MPEMFPTKSIPFFLDCYFGNHVEIRDFLLALPPVSELDFIVFKPFCVNCANLYLKIGM